MVGYMKVLLTNMPQNTSHKPDMNEISLCVQVNIQQQILPDTYRTPRGSSPVCFSMNTVRVKRFIGEI